MVHGLAGAPVEMKGSVTGQLIAGQRCAHAPKGIGTDHGGIPLVCALAQLQQSLKDSDGAWARWRASRNEGVCNRPTHSRPTLRTRTKGESGPITEVFP